MGARLADVRAGVRVQWSDSWTYFLSRYTMSPRGEPTSLSETWYSLLVISANAVYLWAWSGGFWWPGFFASHLLYCTRAEVSRPAAPEAWKQGWETRGHVWPCLGDKEHVRLLFAPPLPFLEQISSPRSFLAGGWGGGGCIFSKALKETRDDVDR